MADLEDLEEVKEKPRACSGLRYELKQCLRESDCVQKYGNRTFDCLRSDMPGVDTECRQIQYAFFECKRSLIDFGPDFVEGRGTEKRTS